MDPALKTVVFTLLGFIVISLGKALFHMSSGVDTSGKALQALSWRIGMSLALFALLMVGSYFHWISPHGGP
jgi:hypothetical protein